MNIMYKDSCIYKWNMYLLFYYFSEVMYFWECFRRREKTKKLEYIEFRINKQKENHNVWKSKGLINFCFIIYTKNDVL